MPLDGTVVAAVTREFQTLAAARIDKIYQPETDELIISARGNGVSRKILLSAAPSCPRAHFTQLSKPNPETAPQFCMVLRKFLSGGRVLSVSQPDFERVIEIQIEQLDEMGDRVTRSLLIEIMGKHSNIILCEGGRIIDSIKRVPHEKSSVREVLPGRPYQPPPSQGKTNPLLLSYENFIENFSKYPDAETAVFQGYTGISPALASEIVSAAQSGEPRAVFESFSLVMERVKNGDFSPAIYSENGRNVDFSAIPLTAYKRPASPRPSVSDMLEAYYETRDRQARAAAKGADLKKLLNNLLSRAAGKQEAHRRTLREISGRERLKLRGELITANIYALKAGMTAAALVNFYSESGETEEIPLDPQKTPAENAQAYFKRYAKEKRAYEAVTAQIDQTDAEISYLEQVRQNLLFCEEEAALDEIRQELHEEGYIKKAAKKRGAKPRKTAPLRFLSSDGLEIFVGRNNRQNEELTLKTAGNSDIWLHTKVIPGSHVIIRAGGASAPDSTIEEAARLAAYFSKGRGAGLIAVDYTTRKNVKKPPGAKTGMVTYDNYKTAYVEADEAIIQPFLLKNIEN